MFIHKRFLCSMFSFLLGKYLEVYLLGHRVGACLTLRETARPVSKVAAQFHIPARNICPSPPLALFVVMLPKMHLTSHSRMSASSIY